MYLIFASKKLVEIIKSIYRQKNLTLMETDLLGEKYLVSHVNPAEVIPYEILKKVRITRTSLDQVKKILDTERKARKKEVLGKIEPGVNVVITAGPYRGMKGVVRKKLPDGKVEILIPVFNMPVPVIVSEEELFISTPHR